MFGKGRRVEQATVAIVLLLSSTIPTSSSIDLGMLKVPFTIFLSSAPPTTVTSSVAPTTVAAASSLTPPSSSSSSSTVSTATSASPTTLPPTSSGMSTSGQPVTSQNPTSSNGSSATTPPTDFGALNAVLTFYLFDTFSVAPGFVTIVPPTIRAIQTANNPAFVVVMDYAVVFNKTTLNDQSLLTPRSSFVPTLQRIANSVSNVSPSSAGFYVLPSLTNSSMTASINSVKTQLSSTSWKCSGFACPAANETCVWKASVFQVSCVDRCQLFTATNNCTSSPETVGVQLEGTCAYDSNNNPYCNCGMTTGDVMSNFYDGNRCISAAFIVAMAACAGGLFVILTVILCCCLRNEKNRKKSSAKSKTAEKYAAPPRHFVDGGGYNNTSTTTIADPSQPKTFTNAVNTEDVHVTRTTTEQSNVYNFINSSVPQYPDNREYPQQGVTIETTNDDGYFASVRM